MAKTSYVGIVQSAVKIFWHIFTHDTQEGDTSAIAEISFAALVVVVVQGCIHGISYVLLNNIFIATLARGIALPDQAWVIPSFPVTLQQAKSSVALLSSSSVGSATEPSTTGKEFENQRSSEW